MSKGICVCVYLLLIETSSDMKSKGKLSNDEKVKFVDSEKVWEWKKKLTGRDIYVHYHKTITLPLTFQCNQMDNGLWSDCSQTNVLEIF